MDDDDCSVPVTVHEHYPSDSHIPIDLFVSKKHPGRTRGHLGFADSSGNILYKILSPIPSSPNKRSFLVLDEATQSPLFSIYPKKNGSWHGFSGNSSEEKDLVFRVKRTVNKLTRTELEVYLVGENGEDTISEFKVKGSPFQRSCTIYKGNSIVAQTSLMYKLRQIFVSRGRFRLTIYPEFVDHALIVALIVIFLDC